VSAENVLRRSDEQLGVTAPCEHCDGHGRRRLNFAEAETMLALTADWKPTHLVYKELGIPDSTACKRLAHLLELGLVERRQVTREPGTIGPTGSEWRRKQ